MRFNFFWTVFIIHTKMLNLDSITNENNKEYNKKWPFIPDHPYRILVIRGSKSGITNALLNLISQQDDIDKIYLYAKDLSEPKYEFLIKTRENIAIKHLSDSNAFIDCSNTMDGVYENISDYNPSRKRKILIVFDDMIADIMSNKEFQVIIKELFIRCRKLNIDYHDFVRSYRECKRKQYSFLTIDTAAGYIIDTLSAGDPEDLGKIFYYLHENCSN